MDQDHLEFHQYASRLLDAFTAVGYSLDAPREIPAGYHYGSFNWHGPQIPVAATVNRESNEVPD